MVANSKIIPGICCMYGTQLQGSGHKMQQFMALRSCYFMNVMLCNTIQCNQPPFSNLPPGNFKYKLNFGGSSKSVIGFMTQLKEKKVSKAFLDDMCESKKGQLLKRKGLRQKMRHHIMQGGREGGARVGPGPPNISGPSPERNYRSRRSADMKTS